MNATEDLVVKRLRVAPAPAVSLAVEMGMTGHAMVGVLTHLQRQDRVYRHGVFWHVAPSDRPMNVNAIRGMLRLAQVERPGSSLAFDACSLLSLPDDDLVAAWAVR